MEEKITNKTAKKLRLTARIIGAIIAGYWLLMGIGYGLSGTEPFTYESLIITILIAATTIGIIVAWKKEKIGGAILVIAGIAFSIFAYISAGHNKIFAALISGVPFILIGTLFLLAWKKSKNPEII